MMIQSKYKSSILLAQMTLYLVGALFLFSMLLTSSKPTLMVKLVVLGIVELIALCIWAFRMKAITVMDQGVEVKQTCLPFLKRYYRLAEFDSYIKERKGNIEIFHLMYQRQRVISIPSNLYDNYYELTQALSVIGLKEWGWGVDESRAVESQFKKSGIAGVFIIFLLILLGFACPIAEHFGDGQITHKSWLVLCLFEILFIPFYLYLIHCYKRLTIWRGQLQVRNLLWPWKVEYYALKEFDSALEVITKNQQGEDYKSLWLIREGKLVESIYLSLYVNPDEVEHAIGIVPKQANLSPIKKLKYHLGKPIDI